MSESLDGVSVSVTRQNAGSVLNAAVAFALVAVGGANAPACTDSADSTRPFVTFICASDSHAIGAGVAALNPSSVAAPSSAIKAAILMRGSLTARGESLAAFDGRCIPAGCVAPRSNTPGILGRRALPSARLARLGATPDFHHGLLNPKRPISLHRHQS